MSVALDISSANQRVLLHRGRARLRETLEDFFRGLGASGGLVGTKDARRLDASGQPVFQVDCIKVVALVTANGGSPGPPP